MQQDYASRAAESNYKYEVVALTSDTDTSLTTVPFFQVQFSTSSDEECAANVTGMSRTDAHARHNQRRNAMRRTAAKFNMVIEFPEKMPDGVTDVTYPSKWYFFSGVFLSLSVCFSLSLFSVYLSVYLSVSLWLPSLCSRSLIL